jgi:hypothetical protein
MAIPLTAQRLGDVIVQRLGDVGASPIAAPPANGRQTAVEIAVPANVRTALMKLLCTLFGLVFCDIDVNGKLWSVLASTIDAALTAIAAAVADPVGGGAAPPRVSTVVTLPTTVSVPMIQEEVSPDVATLYALLGIRTCTVVDGAKRFTLLNSAGRDLPALLAAVARGAAPRAEVPWQQVKFLGAYVDGLPPAVAALAAFFGEKYATVLVPGADVRVAVRLAAATIVMDRCQLAC